MASGTITIPRGNTWGSATPPDLAYEDGTAYTLPVGAVLLFTVKELDDDSDNDDNALIKKDFTNSTVLTTTDTDIEPGTYRYDLKIVGPGLERNSDSGNFIITKRVGVRDGQ
ncbi:MAG: hypothetical protein WCK32_00780 [Chlorobiaceae bacterium]